MEQFHLLHYRNQQVIHVVSLGTCTSASEGASQELLALSPRLPTPLQLLLLCSWPGKKGANQDLVKKQHLLPAPAFFASSGAPVAQTPKTRVQ